MAAEYRVLRFPQTGLLEAGLNGAVREGWRLAAAFPVSDLGTTEAVVVILERPGGAPSREG